MATIEQRIRDDRAGYFGDSVMQARYASLIKAREQQGQGLSGLSRRGFFLLYWCKAAAGGTYGGSTRYGRGRSHCH